MFPFTRAFWVPIFDPQPFDALRDSSEVRHGVRAAGGGVWGGGAGVPGCGMEAPGG